MHISFMLISWTVTKFEAHDEGTLKENYYLQAWYVTYNLLFLFNLHSISLTTFYVLGNWIFQVTIVNTNKLTRTASALIIHVEWTCWLLCTLAQGQLYIYSYIYISKCWKSTVDFRFESLLFSYSHIINLYLHSIVFGQY